MPGWERRVDCGPVTIVVYPNGVACVEHRCEPKRRWAPVVAAPKLNPQHQVIADQPMTILPAIFCVDCGLHGEVRDGDWLPA
jgi:hypothetical protein